MDQDCDEEHPPPLELTESEPEPDSEGDEEEEERPRSPVLKKQKPPPPPPLSAPPPPSSAPPKAKKHGPTDRKVRASCRHYVDIGVSFCMKHSPYALELEWHECLFKGDKACDRLTFKEQHVCNVHVRACNLLAVYNAAGISCPVPGCKSLPQRNSWALCFTHRCEWESASRYDPGKFEDWAKKQAPRPLVKLPCGHEAQEGSNCPCKCNNGPAMWQQRLCIYCKKMQAFSATHDGPCLQEACWKKHIAPPPPPPAKKKVKRPIHPRTESPPKPDKKHQIDKPPAKDNLLPITFLFSRADIMRTLGELATLSVDPEISTVLGGVLAGQKDHEVFIDDNGWLTTVLKGHTSARIDASVLKR